MPLKGEYAEIAAAGSTQATATEMPSYTCFVSSGTGGVMLPPMNKTEDAYVVNGTAVEVNVYPRVGGKINNSTANLAVLLPPNMACHVRAINGAGDVIAIF